MGVLFVVVGYIGSFYIFLIWIIRIDIFVGYFVIVCDLI